VYLASVVTPGYSTKNPYSTLASSISKAFKGAAFVDRESTGAHNVALEKEGTLFVQVIYPDNVFTAGVSFKTLYIKVVQYKSGKVFPVWYCDNIFSWLHSKKF
jgi:hypothetical protein